MKNAPRIAAIIPARMQSSRFPGKPLALICGRTMIEHVYHRTRMHPKFSEVCIATCDEEIARAAEGFGCRAIMTSRTHQRGTDRVAEAARAVDADVIANVQGDEPLIPPDIFDGLLAPFEGAHAADVACTNLMSPLTSDDEQDSLNNVKVVVDRRGRALYFSREPIPTRRMGVRAERIYRQIGIYAFRADVLRAFSTLEPTPGEIAESVDMLRFVEHGYGVHMVVSTAVLQSVDTPDDLRAADALMRTDPFLSSYSSDGAR